MAMKFFSDTILLLHMYSFEGFSNRFKFDETVNNHLNRCKKLQFKKIHANIAKDRGNIYSYLPANSLMLWS